MAEYKMLPAQREFLEIPHNHSLDVALYQGGYGSGKTFSGSLLGILLCLKYAGIRGLVGAQTFPLVRDTTLVEYFNHLDRFGFIKGKHYEYKKAEAKLIFKNGSEVLFRYFEDATRLKSLSLGFVEIEEMSDTPESVFRMLLGRMRQAIKPDWNNFKYRIFGHTNPESSKGWIYKNFVENPKPNYRLILAPTTENIYLPESFVNDLKAAYDPEYYRINVLGEFGDYAKGLVTKGFSDKNKREISYQPEMDLHLSVDFNVDPMSWVLAHKTTDKVFFFDEIVIENTTTFACVEEFHARYPNHQGKIIINGDASGDNRSVNSEYSNYVIMKNRLQQLGYKVEYKIRPCNPSIKSRIASWNAKIKNVNGDVGIYVSPKCKWLLFNIENLSYKEGTSLLDLPSHHQIKNNRDSKFLGHIFDAASYLVEYYWRVAMEYPPPEKRPLTLVEQFKQSR